MDVGENPAQKPPAVTLALLSAWGAPPALQEALGGLWVPGNEEKEGKTLRIEATMNSKESELSPGVWLCRGVLAVQSPWEMKRENVLEQGHLFTL